MELNSTFKFYLKLSYLHKFARINRLWGLIVFWYGVTFEGEIGGFWETSTAALLKLKAVL